MAAAPNDGLVAFGGYGAMGSLGEILLVNPLDGSLSKVLEGHRQTVCSLAFSADGQWLASLDAAGAVIVWKRGQWRARTLYDPDENAYGAGGCGVDCRTAETSADRRGRQRRRGAAGLRGTGFARGRLRWQLMAIQLADTQRYRTLKTVHFGMVTALAATADGSRLASADLEGNLYLWDLRSGRAERLESPAPVLSLCFSPDGGTLAAGTAVAHRERTAPRKANCRSGTFRRGAWSTTAGCPTTSAPVPSARTANAWPT